MDLRCKEDWLIASFTLSIQRSRNISDLPADYGQPACKMRTMSPLQATLRASADLNGVDEADVTSLHSPSEEEEEDGERGGSRYVRMLQLVCIAPVSPVLLALELLAQNILFLTARFLP